MREHIISEIQRLAVLAVGQAPGSAAFETATGIGSSKWRGKYWARWGDALVEAGFQPNSWSSKSDSNEIILGLITACRHYGRFPANSEIELLRRSDLDIPATKTIKNNLGSYAERIAAMRKFMRDAPGYADVLAMLPITPTARPALSKGAKAVDGHVYLLKSGEHYKIGRSDELERRVKEIRIALPDAATLVHAITTDDSSGIEAYWHRRFMGQRANGEWFKLKPEDVKAFMRRKFQ